MPNQSEGLLYSLVGWHFGFGQIQIFSLQPMIEPKLIDFSFFPGYLRAIPSQLSYSPYFCFTFGLYILALCSGLFGQANQPKKSATLPVLPIPPNPNPFPYKSSLQTTMDWGQRGRGRRQRQIQSNRRGQIACLAQSTPPLWPHSTLALLSTVIHQLNMHNALHISPRNQSKGQNVRGWLPSFPTFAHIDQPPHNSVICGSFANSQSQPNPFDSFR
jgi:hypothetical protein